MGEVDTKPIKSVQFALTLFEEKNDQTKDRTTVHYEMERDEELEGLLKGLSNLKVQIEAKEFANKQAILKLDQYEKQTNELSTLLKDNVLEKEIYLHECKEARKRVQELESQISNTSDSLNEDLKIEKQKNKELLERLSKLNEATVLLKIGADEIDKDRCTILSKKEDELKLKLRNAEEKLEEMTKEIEMNKSVAEIQTKKNTDQSSYIELLETDLNRLRLKHENAKEEERLLYPDFEITKTELEKVKYELEETRERETKAQNEILILQSDILKGKSMIKEAEAVQERLKSENCSLYIAVKHLGSEVEAAKYENKILRTKEIKNKAEDDETSNFAKISKELKTVKSDLENAIAKIGELRARAEQATSRADVAEREKAKLEERIARWRERKERRKKAIDGLRAEMIPELEESTSYGYDQGTSASKVHKTYQPLGKVLNMKY